MHLSEELSWDKGLSYRLDIEFEINSSDSEKAKEFHEEINQKFHELIKEMNKSYEQENQENEHGGISPSNAPGRIKAPESDEQ